jgi:PAS domain-containing protein
MNLLNRFHSAVGGLGGLESLSSPNQELAWAWVTLGLSALVAVGYCAIAVNWYCLSKLARGGEARAALRRLRGICLACAVCGCALYAIDVPWPVWRLYNMVLLVLVWRTWSFLFRMRGLSLIDQRLAQVRELERSAEQYREIAELLPHVVWTATADGRVDYANRRWRDFAGDDRLTSLDAVHPD